MNIEASPIEGFTLPQAGHGIPSGSRNDQSCFRHAHGETWDQRSRNCHVAWEGARQLQKHDERWCVPVTHTSAGSPVYNLHIIRVIYFNISRAARFSQAGRWSGADMDASLVRRGAIAGTTSHWSPLTCIEQPNLQCFMPTVMGCLSAIAHLYYRIFVICRLMMYMSRLSRRDLSVVKCLELGL